MHRSCGTRVIGLVGELTVRRRSTTGRTCGSIGSENVGISNESEVRIFAVENPRFPGEGSSSQGQSGPKARPTGVADGQQVDNPVLPIRVKERSRDTGG